jgi:hypothetical protein
LPFILVVLKFETQAHARPACRPPDIPSQSEVMLEDLSLPKAFEQVPDPVSATLTGRMVWDVIGLIFADRSIASFQGRYLNPHP